MNFKKELSSAESHLYFTQLPILREHEPKTFMLCTLCKITVPPLCSFLSMRIKTSLLFSPVGCEIERLITASNLFHHMILTMGLQLGMANKDLRLF